MIAIFSDDGGYGRMFNQLNLVDTAAFGYPRDAPAYEIIEDTDVLMLAAPSPAWGHRHPFRRTRQQDRRQDHEAE